MHELRKGVQARGNRLFRFSSVCALMVILANCDEQQNRLTSSFEETVAVQRRVNRYFRAQVMPKLRECWSGLQGEGTVTMTHIYARDGKGGWVPSKLELDRSTLLKEQDRVALVCMQEAVEETSLPVGRIEQGEDEFVLHWTWPVPLPASAPQKSVLFFGPGGGIGPDDDEGGCDGNGALAECFNCDHETLECMSTCVGYRECDNDDNFTTCIAKGACASGGPFGFVGVVIQ